VAATRLKKLYPFNQFRRLFFLMKWENKQVVDYDSELELLAQMWPTKRVVAQGDGQTGRWMSSQRAQDQQQLFECKKCSKMIAWETERAIAASAATEDAAAPLGALKKIDNGRKKIRNSHLFFVSPICTLIASSSIISNTNKSIYKFHKYQKIIIECLLKLMLWNTKKVTKNYSVTQLMIRIAEFYYRLLPLMKLIVCL